MSLETLQANAAQVSKLKQNLTSEAVYDSFGPYKAKGHRCNLCNWWWARGSAPHHHPKCVLA
jgi:hypothetical protein